MKPNVRWVNPVPRMILAKLGRFVYSQDLHFCKSAIIHPCSDPGIPLDEPA